ncbi:MAG TPA: STAS domain-containing protein [Solirubrobacteraceae bacterium]
MHLACPTCHLSVRRSSDDPLGRRCPRCGAPGVWRDSPPTVAGDCTIEVQHAGLALIVRVTGEVDMATVEALRAATVVSDGDHESLVIDLSPTTFIDSAGIHALVEAQQRAKRHDVRLVVITVPGSPVDRALELVNAQTWLSVIHEGRDPAAVS